MSDIYLFSYGTLQFDDVQMASFGRLLDGEEDFLVGFKNDKIEITDPDVLAKSGERFHPIVTQSGDISDVVKGMVFKITHQELLAADKYEVADYKRVETTLKSGKKAWVYIRA